MKRLLSLLALGCLCALPVLGQQQSGSISGKVTSPDGDPIPGVTVQASGDVLPQPLTAVTTQNGSYRFPNLPPGNYSLSYKLEGMATETRTLIVKLGLNSDVNVKMAPEAVEASIEVTGQAGLIDPTSAQLKSAVDNKVIQSLPVGQDYRDLQKLISGVQITNDSTRGPSAGGSGQDNVYLYDGVNVGMPLFGVLSAEPSAHDIDQVSTVKGGANAVDFNRSGGFLINSISKSGTNKYHGEASYQLQNSGMTDSQKHTTTSIYDENKDWTVANIGGPVVQDRLFFYGSYYRPTVDRNNRANAYGSVPKYNNTRDEYFGRLSFQPTDNILIHGSYRDSKTTDANASVGSFETASASTGDESKLKIGILEGSWSTTADQYLTFKWTDYKNDNAGLPDNRFNIPIALDGSVPLNVNDLAHQGYFEVPTPLAGMDAYNMFIDPLIQQYGFLDNGVPTGGGAVGGADLLNYQNFFRKDYQGGYNWFFGQDFSQDIHVGYQQYKESEDLARISNGWGIITAPGGTDSEANSIAGAPVYYQAELYAQGVQSSAGQGIPTIHSEFKSQNIELNDTMRWNNFTFNVGALVSNDKLYGQGLRKSSATASGYEICISCQYLMHEVKWSDQIQPRLGVVWAYNGHDTVFANYAKYNPAASSLPRAASWARNLTGAVDRAYFDANGNLLATKQFASSSGKFFEAGIMPRTTDEIVLGTARQINSRWTARFSTRYRHSYRFWEDTPNTARQAPDAPSDIPHTLYIPDLNAWRAEVGGSSYVIARLNNAFTKYYDATFEAEYHGDKMFVRGSYVWSHYYGNFDQDATTTNNDQAIFIGSSNLADGVGRQVWNSRYGNLAGDRRHQIKVYGYYTLPWNANVGALAFYQSGAPWQSWNRLVYAYEYGGSSDTSRYSEAAGTHTTDPHYQLDLNYTQNFQLPRGLNLQLRADLYNVFNRQTGYDIQPNVHSAGYGQPLAYWSPRRLQLQARISF